MLLFSPTNCAAAVDILKYFVRNPHAADSLEGIATWRLLEERVHQTVEATDQALNWLVGKEYLKEASSPGLRKIFFLNADKLPEVREILGLADAEDSSGAKKGPG